MEIQFGNQTFESESRYLTLALPDSSAMRDDPAALRDRMKEDGFLLLRGFHDREAILAARRDILLILAAEGKLDPNAPLMDGVIHPSGHGETTSVRGRESLKKESLRQVVFAPQTRQFFDRYFGEESLYLNFQWLRAAGRGAASAIHYDVVFMGRGSRRLCTLWTPLGHIPPEMGPLVICRGSHRWQHVIETYGNDDVDRHVTSGVFSEDPAELVDRFGGRWATTTFYPGDAVILGMHTMHASLTNTTNRYRISCDTRYQPSADPIDERWSGTEPLGHPVMWGPNAQLESVKASRRRWGM